jgi:hypothetical protein
MSLLQKPTNIYHTSEQNTASSKDSWMNEFEDMFKKDLGEKVVEETLKQDKIEVLVEPEKVEEPTIDELSYDEKLEFIKKFANEFNLEFTMKVTPAIVEEPTPVVTPTIEPVKEEVVVPEPVKEEVVIQPEPVKEEVKVVTPKETEKPITFNFEKPEGWNKKRKKINFFKVLINGIFDVDMDPSDFKRYEKFKDNFKPAFFILLILSIVIGGLYFKSSYDETAGKKMNVVDRAFNFCVETYDKWTGRDKKYFPIDTIKVYNQDTPIDETFKINYTPYHIDTLNKVDSSKTIDDWEKLYQQLDSTK